MIETGIHALEIIDRITDGLLTLDNQYRLTYINQEALLLLSRNGEELIGKNIWAECPDAIELKLHEHCIRSISEQVPVKFEELLKRTKQRLFIRIYPSPTGLTICLEEMGHAQPESNQVDEELRSTREMLETFIHNNADAIWVIDLNDIVLQTNHAFEVMFQWSSKETVGKPLPIVPDFLKSSIDFMHSQVKSGRVFVNFETQRQRKDGSLVWVNASLSPISNTEGHIVGLAGVCRDISERKLAEQSLRKTKEQLESFIDHHIDAVLLFNQEGRVIRMNEAFQTIFGWELSDFIGKIHTELVHIPDGCLEEASQLFEIINKAGSIKGRETKRLKKDGTIIDVQLSGFAITDSNHEFDGWSVMLRDITEWKKTQELVQNSEKLNVAGQLAAGIAHEIRNPITAIKGFLQLMKSGLDKERYYHIMTSEIERIEMIVSELLFLAKPQINMFQLNDIRLILDQITTLLSTQAIINNVQIKLVTDNGTYGIMCDGNQMKQVFINYIKNAIEAMPNGGTILITLTHVNENRMSITITDQGCGIPEHVLAKLGQPFYTTKENGTGLGFMVSKRIIENHKGTVAVKSEENKGTTIEVSLPTGIH